MERLPICCMLLLKAKHHEAGRPVSDLIGLKLPPEVLLYMLCVDLEGLYLSSQIFHVAEVAADWLPPGQRPCLPS